MFWRKSFAPVLIGKVICNCDKEHVCHLAKQGQLFKVWQTEEQMDTQTDGEIIPVLAYLCRWWENMFELRLVYLLAQTCIIKTEHDGTFLKYSISKWITFYMNQVCKSLVNFWYMEGGDSFYMVYCTYRTFTPFTWLHFTLQILVLACNLFFNCTNVHFYI